MKRLTQILITLTVLFSLFLPIGAQEVQAAPYSYTNSVSYNIPDGTSSTATGCVAWPATRYFLVNDSFTINDLNVEFSQSHASRGQIRMTLLAPDGTKRELISTSGDTDNNYYITLDDDGTGSLDDGNDDTIGGTRRSVDQNLLTDFEGKNAFGTWMMTICDNTYTGSQPSQTFNAATLVFDGTAVTPTPKNHKQGPAIEETYYLPWPEDQVRTAFNRTYDSTCSTYTSFRDNYDAVPREPTISYTGLTIVDAGTVITYDHWEDGYEVNPSFPSQNTTQVWGDSDLTNGAAPGDADDYFINGQILILDNAMLSTTLGAVVDYDARDKIAVSKPINVSRSVWSDGSQTLLAAADEVYPVDRWGTQFYSPLGDNANLNDMFDISVVSIIAAYDGTLVDIDKDGDGTYETTGIALNEGDTYLIDDTGNGMYRGGAIRSNIDHPIQVNLMTADRCAGYESRTYPLLPFDQWDASYYLPVSTIQTATGPGGDDAPTTVHVYNPNTSSITVNYDYDTGNAGSLNIPANSSAYAVVTSGKASHFYSVVPGLTNNVRDEFTAQSYSNNNGSVNWATSWTEVNDTNGATGGDIFVRDAENELAIDGADAGDYIYRSANLSGYTSATLTFAFDESVDGDGNEELCVDASDDGTTWTELICYGNNDDGNKTINLSSYAGGTVFIRFYNEVNLETDDEFYFDNVDITFTAPGTGDPPVFYAVASVDSDNAGGSGSDQNSTYDWGITMVPENVMSQWLIVGWAPGDDPTFEGTNIENTAPIWLTGGYPLGSSSSGTYDICVDYNGDCTSGTCTLDPVSGRYYDRMVTGITPLTQVKIYKGVVNPPDAATQGTPGEDQTGTSIWVCGPTTTTPARDTILDTDILITAAWGEDPLVAQPSKPGVDLGYTVRNQRAWRAFKSAELQVDLNSNGLYDEGDTVRYTITVFNVGATIIPEVIITDTNDPDVTYVANSTYLVNDGTAPPASGQIPDSPSSGDFPLDSSGSGYTYTDFDRFSFFSIYYDAVINFVEPFKDYRTNVAHITVGTRTVNPDVTIEVRESEELGSIGNYVWLDEDGDGDQDAGEAGIPNLLVTITNGTDTYTTYTDANGGYLFTDLPEGTWTVTVTPATGLNPTYDEDGIVTTPNSSVVTLGAGAEHLSADFGYNWSTPTETNDPPTDATGAIGDRVWADYDAQGDQDPSEVGIEGVEVQLWYDSDGDGVVDAQYGSSVYTDANGNYIFDNLPAGIYEVRIPNPPAGYTQTGDPDGTLDHKTGVVLAPGDVFVNADFGYSPTTAEVGWIGDTIWLDANANGTLDANGGEEYGLAGVTVSLIKDTNGNGVWDVGEPIIATDITDEYGNYLFTGVPAGAGQDYIVWVNDTEGTLHDLVPTYDDDGIVTTPNSSVVTNLTTAGDLDQDFGYAPPNHDAGDGLIGDTVWLDANNNGVWDPGEGMEGVVVRLYASDGTTLLATTTTNEDGLYFFGNLPVDETYIVQVATGTLPFPGLTNFDDPDGGNDSLSTVTLTSSDPIDLAQDFGYRDESNPNTISGTIWEDTDADGTLEGGESGRFEDVTVVLRDANGDIVASTVTDASGNYSFTNLPDGTYTVDVTDDNNILNGYWHSDGPNDGADNNSQVDPYTVTVSGGQTNSTADFGYYIEPAAVGNRIWWDANGDGIQDGGETGVADWPVTLTITWPNGTTTVIETSTDSSGYYSFENLLLDEDYDGVGTGEPVFTITTPIPLNIDPSPANEGTDNTVDSDGVQSGSDLVVTVGVNPEDGSPLVQGMTNTDYDFGFNNEPTAIDLPEGPDGYVVHFIHVTWTTANESQMLGFKLHRQDAAGGPQELVYTVDAAFKGQQLGTSYEFVDENALAGHTYTYLLEVLMADGSSEWMEPTQPMASPYRFYLPILSK